MGKAGLAGEAGGQGSCCERTPCTLGEHRKTDPRENGQQSPSWAAGPAGGGLGRRGNVCCG